MKKQLEIDFSFGYVYDKSKLIVMYPVGTNEINEEDYEMEVEVAFLEDGIEVAFEEGDIIEANATMKPLEMFLMKPSKIIPFVISIKNSQTKEELNKLIKEFDEEYEIKNNYIKKGYEIKDVYDVFSNVEKYIPKENLETLNILKIDSSKFDIESLIKTTKENLDEVVESNLIPIKIEKSKITNRLFIKSENQETKDIYIPFAVDGSNCSKEIICASGENIQGDNLDFGDLEISNTMDAGYIIEKDEENLNIKISNFNYQTDNNNQIVQIVDYAGILKLKMIDFINKFVK
ncbi:hypothetical protein CHF27_006940 [Romboutsia maritimum]|uniref:Uncharacterized protein n=1 Tax=Romboutsia maritimum TaxID=2020948 RepID=A0A371IT82_9FIRM|nr:hypothetical protein [Romboutsia maritimum]RDY23665.1 hypothetical protein CHF27_006940 [Romboutsia maritimum]